MKIISGENIQLRCDYLIGTKRDLDFNPKLKQIANYKKINIDEMRSPLQINHFSKICCYSHLLLRKDFIEKMKLIKTTFDLYLHNSDLNFTSKYLYIFSELKHLKDIYTQNMCLDVSRVHPIPIGIANEMWKHGNTNTLKKYIEFINTGEIKKTNDIFFNFNVSTNNSVRKSCKYAIENKNIPWINNTKNQEEYLKNLSSYKFAICPEGNGVDTHRFWECLYLKVVPICKKNKLVDYYSNIFPALVINEWKDLDINSLNYNNHDWKNYHKLDLNYVIKDEIVEMDEIDEPAFTCTTYDDPEQESVFDIVIPVGPNESDNIKHQIEYTKKNVIGYRNIYIICFDPKTKIDDCITIDETIFPFNIKTVSSIHGSSWRNGWYLQQLLKLYAGLIVPNILDTYLVIDADTFFMKPTSFIKENKCCYNYGKECHAPYFNHMKLLDGSLKRIDKEKSGICHHMMFETEKIKKLFSLVEKNHPGKKFYEIFLDNVDRKFHSNGSGASEYEMYFNYILTYHKDEIIIRKLHWKDSKTLDAKMDYISIHWHFKFKGLENWREVRKKLIEEAQEKRNNLM
tara:strand:- start:142 stop:1851 length:1710 start_codon:yes stop_codon:yes gene_type:complete